MSTVVAVAAPVELLAVAEVALRGEQVRSNGVVSDERGHVRGPGRGARGLELDAALTQSLDGDRAEYSGGILGPVEAGEVLDEEDETVKGRLDLLVICIEDEENEGTEEGGGECALFKGKRRTVRGQGVDGYRDVTARSRRGGGGGGGGGRQCCGIRSRRSGNRSESGRDRVR